MNSIYCATCGYWVHGQCLGVQGSLARVAQSFVCKVCRGGGTQAADKFRSDDVELECVSKFAYLGDMLNDTGGVEQAVTARVRAAWKKFRELGGILCTRGASLRMKDVVYKACVCNVLTHAAETWAMKVGVFQRLQATERRMLRMICGVMLRDNMESAVIASRVGVDDLEEH